MHSDQHDPGLPDLEQKVRSCNDMTARLANIDPSHSITYSGVRSPATVLGIATIDADPQPDALVF